jgi:endogenous inhibitor of DNA gyrase (YacG/DUF329 family)
MACAAYSLSSAHCSHHMHAMPDRIESAGRCPICRKPAVDKFRPFCSKRCADIDLNRWLSGVYAIPVSEDSDEDGTPQQDGQE